MMQNKKYKTILINLIVPVMFALLSFVVTRPISAELGTFEERLSAHLVSNNVEVEMETVDDRSHIYYEFENIKTFITSDSTNNKQPKTNGEYITYVKEIAGEGQIFLYYIPTKKTIQLTRVGPNLNPNVSRLGKVAWEGWVLDQDGRGTWQIFGFDGAQIRQISQGDISLNPSVYGDYILFSRKSSLGEWRSEVYSFIENDTRVVAIGFQNKTVSLDGDNIVYEDGGVFPLKPSDFFLLDINTNIVPQHESVDSVPEILPSEFPVEQDIEETDLTSTSSASIELE